MTLGFIKRKLCSRMISGSIGLPSPLGEEQHWGEHIVQQPSLGFEVRYEVLIIDGVAVFPSRLPQYEQFLVILSLN